MQELWKSALVHIQDIVSADEWDRWFQGTVGVRTTGGVLRVSVADEEQYHALDRGFMEVIEHCVHQAAGESLLVELRHDASIAGAAPEGVEPSAVLPLFEDPQLSLFGAGEPVELFAQAVAEPSAAFDHRRRDDGPLFAGAFTEGGAWQPAAQEAAPAPSYEERLASARLHRQFTFENYVVGDSNEFAVNAAQVVAERPGQAYNPLFIYGGVGLGKTHLLNAIGCSLLKRFPNARVRYLSGEALVNDLVNSIRDNRMDDFRQRTRTEVDLLLIDDIQFIAGKERTQAEFFHMFNDLHQAGKQIVVTSDRIPAEINLLEDRIQSRLSMGLIADIKPPDYETRLAILRTRSGELGVNIPADVLEFLAKIVRANVRELHGTLNRVASYARHCNVPVTIDIARDQLSSIYKEELSRPSPDAILRATAEYCSLRTADLLGRGRTARVAQARKIAMYVARQITGASYPELGRFFSGRDHTTIMSACESIAKQLEESYELRQMIQGIHRKLGIA